MSATNQLFGVCDSSGAQKSTVSSPQSVEAVPVDGMVNGKPPLNQSSKTCSSNQTAIGQVNIKGYVLRIFSLYYFRLRFCNYTQNVFHNFTGNGCSMGLKSKSTILCLHSRLDGTIFGCFNFCSEE